MIKRPVIICEHFRRLSYDRLGFRLLKAWQYTQKYVKRLRPMSHLLYLCRLTIAMSLRNIPVQTLVAVSDPPPRSLSP